MKITAVARNGKQKHAYVEARQITMTMGVFSYNVSIELDGSLRVTSTDGSGISSQIENYGIKITGKEHR